MWKCNVCETVNNGDICVVCGETRANSERATPPPPPPVTPTPTRVGPAMYEPITPPTPPMPPMPPTSAKPSKAPVVVLFIILLLAVVIMVMSVTANAAEDMTVELSQCVQEVSCDAASTDILDVA